MLEMGEAKPLSRVRIWNGSTPWLITGHAVARELFADARVSVDDRGEGFDPTSLPEHPPVTDPERLNFERGLGIPLIRTLVDEVAFDSSDDGTSVTMTLYCGRHGED